LERKIKPLWASEMVYGMVLDFVHKLKISLKELRETKRWLKLIQRIPLIEPAENLDSILEET